MIKKNKQSDIVINTCNARHELPLLMELIKQNKWKNQYLRDKIDGVKIFWIEKLDQDSLNYIQNHYMIFNKLPGIDVASDKGELEQILRKCIKYDPDIYDYIPNTFQIQNELLQKAMNNSKKTFIFKPNDGSEGCGIFLAQKYQDIPTFAFQRFYVAQEYLDNPLLLNNKKFDLRIFDLGNSEGKPIISYMCDEALVRLCTEDYIKPNSQNMHNLLSHLTNYSLNKLSDKFKKADQLDNNTQLDCRQLIINYQNIQNDSDHYPQFFLNKSFNISKQTLSSLFNQLKQQNIQTDQILYDIKRICSKTLCAMQPYALFRQSQMIDSSKTQGDCFQIIGFDIFVDENLKCWLLEINSCPSMNILFSLEGGVGEGLIKKNSEIDRFVKTKCMGDAFNLLLQVRSKDKSKKLYKLENIEQFESYSKLDTKSYINSIYLKGLKVFQKLAGNQQVITSSKFVKLSKKLSNTDFNSTQYELLYQKLTFQNAGKNSSMGLELFYYALERLEEIFKLSKEIIIEKLL